MKYMKNNKTVIWIVVILLFVAGLFIFQRFAPGPHDTFAMCLREKGALFYGAFWCPHCQSQKQLFGASAKLLPYVECSTPDQKGVTQICIDADIKNYPTWEFADGSRKTGVIPLQELAEQTECVLN